MWEKSYTIIDLQNLVAFQWTVLFYHLCQLIGHCFEHQGQHDPDLRRHSDRSCRPGAGPNRQRRGRAGSPRHPKIVGERLQRNAEACWWDRRYEPLRCGRLSSSWKRNWVAGHGWSESEQVWTGFVSANAILDSVSDLWSIVEWLIMNQ